MKEKTKRIYQYLIMQLSQTSTWRGLVLLLSATGALVSEDMKEVILTFGIMLAGLLAVLFPDQIKKKDE